MLSPAALGKIANALRNSLFASTMTTDCLGLCFVQCCDKGDEEAGWYGEEWEERV